MSPGAVPAPHPVAAAVREEAARLALRIYWRRFSRRVQAAGLDPEDGAQEAVVGVLTRLGSWRVGGGAPLEWWVGRSVNCAVSNLITASRRPCRSAGVESLSLEAGGEADVAVEAEAGRLDLAGLIEGMDVDGLIEIGRALQALQGAP